jgi:hypothetical protein
MLVSQGSQMQTLVIDLSEKMYPLAMRLMPKGNVRSCQKEHSIRELMAIKHFFSILCSSRTSIL